jgi:hypothetical protein
MNYTIHSSIGRATATSPSYFAKICELSRTISQLSDTKDEPIQKSLMQKAVKLLRIFWAMKWKLQMRKHLWK